MLLLNLGVFACILIPVGFWAYRRLLPKAIPGIPYDKNSAQRILGDLPEVKGIFKAAVPYSCTFAD